MAKKIKTAACQPSKADVMKFIMMYDFLESAYVEMKDFSKKSPDTTLNARKVKSLNRILNDIKNILVNEPTFSYLYLLDEEMLPSNSDVVLMMSQYRSAMENYRKKYRTYQNYSYYWNTTEGDIKAIELEGNRPQWK